MKTYFTLLIALLISISSFAQQGINYKAVIKDGSGNLVTSPTINLRFTIQKSDGTGVYTETHTNTTVSNGIIIVNIGEGTTTDVFSKIDWSANNYQLQVELDIEQDGTFVPMGNATPFKAVPYTKFADRASIADNAATKIDDLSDGKSDTNGSSLFIGLDAGLADDGTNNNNVGVGFEVLKANTTGSSNTANGYRALYSNTTGSTNVANGYHALYSNTTGLVNVANGSLALYSNTTGSNNTANGFYSLVSNTSGNNNISLGTSAGSQNVSGSDNIFIGNGAGGTSENQSNKLYIDNSSTSSPLIFGDFNSNFVRVNGYLNINASTTNPLSITSSQTDNYIRFDTSTGYKGYSGIFSGDNDMDFGTGAGNAIGKVHLVTNASPKLTVAANGNVGIGNINPTQALDVVGKIKVTNDSATPTPGTMRFNESTNAFEGFINGTGWVTLGKKKTPKSIVLPASQFVPSKGPVNYSTNAVGFSRGSSSAADGVYIVAPVVLPVGSKLTSISYVFEDNSPSNDLDFVFSKYCGDVSSTSETQTIVNLHAVTGVQNPNLSKYTYSLNETITPGCQYVVSVSARENWVWQGIVSVHKVYITYEEE